VKPVYIARFLVFKAILPKNLNILITLGLEDIFLIRKPISSPEKGDEDAIKSIYGSSSSTPFLNSNNLFRGFITYKIMRIDKIIILMIRRILDNMSIRVSKVSKTNSIIKLVARYNMPKIADNIINIYNLLLLNIFDSGSEIVFIFSKESNILFSACDTLINTPL
jgi:hypothetical protein